eukprot:gene20867-22919_t
MEDTTMQLRDMRNTTGEQQVALVRARASHKGKPTKEKTQVLWKIRKEQKQCGYCGLTHEERHCPAFGKKCRKCQKMNHFAAVCKSRTDGSVDRPEKRPGNSRFPRTAYGVKKMTADEEDSASSYEEFIVKHLKQKDVKKLQVPDSDCKIVVLRLNDVDMKVEPDSGADVNLMDEHQFKALAHRTSGNLRLESCHTKLNTLQGNQLVKGEFHTILRNETRGTETKFIVVYGRIKSAPLIGKKTLETLGMIQIQPDGSLGERNDLKIPIKNIKSVRKENSTKKEKTSLKKYLWDNLIHGIHLWSFNRNRDLNQRDDILIGGRDMNQHSRILEIVLQRALDCGIKFNLDKCKFGVEELEFYGYRLTKDGLKPTPDKFIPKYSTLTAPLRELTQKNTKFEWGPKEKEAFNQLKGSIASEDVMAYFDPNKPITVRCEASFHEGLSAGLFQETSKGNQPVHFTMTRTEKRYSQTEKDALCVAWAKKRFRMYLLGAPRFKIITAHKPLLSLFNKATSKLLPRIERWVMDMQDVNYELVYEPGKNEKDPLDFISRHPLSDTEEDTIEASVRSVVKTENAIIMDHIQEETKTDEQLQKLMQRIHMGDWEVHQHDPDIAPFFRVRSELCIVEDVVFRLNQIVIARSLQRKVVKSAHSLGHFGMSKAKRMLREKYWFPKMNKMVGAIIAVIVGQ